MGYLALNIMVNSYLTNQDCYSSMDAISENDGF